LDSAHQRKKYNILFNETNLLCVVTIAVIVMMVDGISVLKVERLTISKTVIDTASNADTHVALFLFLHIIGILLYRRKIMKNLPILMILFVMLIWRRR
jgi:hypothetical protein